eukprot:jgi/Tetstr1/430894/TSEL_020651.t1
MPGESGPVPTSQQPPSGVQGLSSRGRRGTDSRVPSKVAIGRHADPAESDSTRRRRSMDTSAPPQAAAPLLQPREYLGKHVRPPSGKTSSARRTVSSSSARKGSAAEQEGGQDGGMLASVVSELARKLEAAEQQLKAKEAKIRELASALATLEAGQAQASAARRAAKDAVKEMADQNTKLIRAYLDKKREIKEIHKQSREERKHDIMIELLQHENAQLRVENIALRNRLAVSERAQNSGASTSSQEPQQNTRKGDGAGERPAETAESSCSYVRSLSPKTIRIASLEDENRRLSADSAALRSEQQAILQRAVQRDKTDHFTQLGTLASQKHSYEEAIKHFSSALAVGDIEPHHTAVLYSSRAACHLCLANHMASIYDSTLAIQLDPSLPRSYRRRADAFTAIGDYFAATADLETMKQLGACPVEMQATVDRLLELCSRAAPVNHYQVLGVAPGASEQEIRAAFRAAALKFHPDKAPDGTWRVAAEVVFRLVSEASRVLSDPITRATFDKALRECQQETSGRPKA